ncbi:MAG: hypothetical protein ABH810_03000, partial [bacterium]
HSEQREESPMNMGSGIRQRSFVKTQDDTKKTFFNGPRIALPGLKILTLAIFVSLFFAPVAQAAPYFNTQQGNDTFKNWTESSGLPTTSASLTNPSQFCNDLFKFEDSANSPNLFKNTFCDLAAIVAVAVGDFATNVTCTIQQVAMSNYDNNIKFELPSTSSTTGGGGSASLCKATNSINSEDVFGAGTATDSGGSGLYSSTGLSQLTNDLQLNGSSWISGSYKMVRNIAALAAVVLLFFFAFANIFHLNVNTYAIKKLIPNLIVAVIGGYLSIFVIFFISRGIDFLYRLSIFSPYHTLHPFYNIMNGPFENLPFNTAGQGFASMQLIYDLGGKILGAAPETPTILGGIIGIIFLIIPAVTVFAFEYILALRPVAVGILTIISPLAFATYILPQTQNIFKKWWTILLIVLLYAPIVNFIFFLMGTIPIPNSSLILMLSILLKTAVIVFLIRLPFTIETDIKKISLALSKSSFAGNLGLTKPLNAEIKVKEQNKVGVTTDKALESKAAKSLIAPVNKSYSRNITAEKRQARQRGFSYSQLISRESSTIEKNVDEIGANAHKTNQSRPSNLLANSISDLKTPTIKEIIASSNPTIFRNRSIVSQLKQKDGQLLDDQGAAIRADASRKIVRLAQVVESGKVKNPEAIKALSQKGMLNVLPIEVLKTALQQSVIGQEDLNANFKDPKAAYEHIANYKRGNLFNNAQINSAIEQDYRDASKGFTDLKTALESNLALPSPQRTSAPSRAIEQLRTQNQTFFDKNAPYYIQRLKESNNLSKTTIAQTLTSAGVNTQTASAISQNGKIDFEQIKKYLPQTASPEIVTTIKENVDKRDASSGAISQIAKAFKEDKATLSRTVAEKVSESFRTGTSKSFDDVKSTLSEAVKNLGTGASPEKSRSALSQVNTFAPGTAIASAAEPTSQEMEKAKDKGEEVINTINEMRAAGVDEKTVTDNPEEAVKSVEEQVDKQITDVISGETKDGKSFDQQLTDIASSTPIK